MQKAVEKIVKELASKYDLPEQVITVVIESQFKCAKEEIAKAVPGKPETFKNVRFKKLGLIYADHNRIKAIEYARGNRGTEGD
jgi:hypothetical protein